MIRPTSVRLESSSSCQLRCPSCSTAEGRARPVLGDGYLKLADFRRLLDADPRIRHVELSNYGEMFLNPQLVPIMELAHGRGVTLTAANGVNLNDAPVDALEALVRCRFLKLTCSIDGATEETYAKYRVRGRLGAVLDNVARINAFKTKHRSRFPILTWQFIPFPHNEHELPEARRMARALGMRFFVKPSWDEPVDVGRSRRPCRQLWTSPQVNWDGKVLGCCVNYWGDYGNAFDSGPAAAFNAEKIEYARGMLAGEKPERADVPCSSCAVYRGMRREGRWLTAWDISLSLWRRRLEVMAWGSPLYRRLRSMGRR